jgi:putative copper resistance protein D
MPERLLDGLMVAATVAVDLGLALLMGAIASRLWLRGRDSAWRTGVLAQARDASRFGFVLALAGLSASAWFEAAAMAETPLLQAGPSLADLLLRTHFGHAWIVGLVAWAVAGLLPMSRADGEPRPARLAAVLAALSIFIATRSVVSHAANRGDFTLDVAVDWFHLALVGAWVGIVLAGARLTVPREDAPPRARADATLWVRHMSSTATAALGGVAATGLFKAWRTLVAAPSLPAFVDSPYGRTLGAKLVLVAAAIALGGLNRFLVLPRLFRQLDGELAGGPWRARLTAILRLEAATLALALVAAAILVGTEPPGAS